MSRRTWKKDEFYITYGKPTITAYPGASVKSMDDVMYFYYDISVLVGNKILFQSRTHDFPKVQDLSLYIDHLIDMKDEELFVCEDLSKNGFMRKKLYGFVELDDDFIDMEYFYKIEKHVTYVKQRDESDPKRHEEYTLTIGQHAPNKGGFSNGENYGESVFIKYLSKDDLESLKKTAQGFCECALDDYYKFG